MLLRIHPKNPCPRDINKIVEVIRDGGIVIYPTDSVYGIGCDFSNLKAIERIARIKGIQAQKHDFSIICYDLSHISDFTLPFSNTVFKLMKKNLPGPFTFILNASSKVPKNFKNNKKTIGIRIPDNNIPREIVNVLGSPIVTTSVRDDDEFLEYSTDPELVYEKYKNLVDIVIDGGYGNLFPSTIVDCSGDEPEILREGMGELVW